MPTVRLASETDFTGWREAARRLRLARVPPEAASWRVGGETGLLDDDDVALLEPEPGAGFSVAREFVDLAGFMILNRAEDRFDRMYRLLWRLQAEPNLIRILTDPEVSHAMAMQKQVTQAIHKMHAFVRFRRVDDQADPEATETFAAWFEPPHRVVERGADYFVKRMANLRFSILSPDACVHWDGLQLVSTPGVDKPLVGEDELEAHWRTYYASVFNPARLNEKVMTQHMPRKYWRNLPEAEVISTLTREAQSRTTAMVTTAPTTPSPRAMRAAARASRDAPIDSGIAPADLEEIAASIQVCRRCDLWRDATQAVAGEGPTRARLMFVGEQPGDQEDLSGQPFVGPAGQMLNRALDEAGVPRDEAYVTNAVKHFKYELRGKRRIHQNPNAGEVKACRWWLDNERRLVRPQVVVALGGTAASAVLGRPVAVMRERGPAGELSDGAKAFVTVHPSMLLRIPDAAGKAAAYKDFVRDLAAAWALVA